MSERTLSKKDSWKEEFEHLKKDSSVKEISSRFTGSSVPVSEAEFQKQMRMRAYAKIKSFNTVSKRNIKKLNSPRKHLLMREWSHVVAHDKVGELDQQHALDFLAEYGVTENGMDADAWKEWLEAIEAATSGNHNLHQSESMENMSALAPEDAEAPSRQASIALQIETERVVAQAAEESHTPGSSRSLSPVDVLTYSYDENSTPMMKSNKPTPKEAASDGAKTEEARKEELSEVATRLSLEELVVDVSGGGSTEATPAAEVGSSSSARKFSYSKLTTNTNSSGSGKRVSISEETPLTEGSLNSNHSADHLLESAQHTPPPNGGSEVDDSPGKSSESTRITSVDSRASTKNPLTYKNTNNVDDHSPKTTTPSGMPAPISVATLPAQGTTRFVRPPLEPAVSINSVESDATGGGSSMFSGSEYTTYTTDEEEHGVVPPTLQIDSTMSVISSLGDDDATTAHNPNQIIKVAPVYHIDQHSKNSSMKSPVANAPGGGSANPSTRTLRDDDAEEERDPTGRRVFLFACCFRQPPQKKKEDKGKLIAKNTTSSNATTLKRSLDE